MDWIDFLDPNNAVQHPFIVAGILVAFAFWLVGFSRRKILQDLDILERLEKLDPENQARPAVRSAISFWVTVTYGWPLLGSIFCFAIGGFLLLSGGWLGWLALKLHSAALATLALVAVFESMLMVFLSWLQQRRLKDAHFAKLLKWKP